MNNAGRANGSQRRAILLLALGATAGLSLAAAGLLLPATMPTEGLPAGAVARVGSVLILAEKFERAVEGLASDKRNALSEADKRRVLDRLIDEELLVQRGLDLGLVRQDRRVRNDLTRAVIDGVIAGTAQVDPSSAELERFYWENRQLFLRPGRLRVGEVFVRVAEPSEQAAGLARAQEATRRLRRGEPIAEVRTRLGDREIAPLPDVALPPAKLREYLGPTALRAALGLELGAVSEPLRSVAGYRVLELLERTEDELPVLAAIEDVVRSEYRRRTGDRALRDYLDGLRKRGGVIVADKLP